ncbi:hypothetical protein E2562_031544 [Oryza meyeriana var. granulata]|uniref:Secreted protein n=1 Tax=Oryza meyeriana var. granulata TaxID=110450 RepID=A0A6G1FE94_9ORYZ|nr:hypothetical protein E2562_031544 [Oryza meyeriana var. granulata]
MGSTSALLFFSSVLTRGSRADASTGAGDPRRTAAERGARRGGLRRLGAAGAHRGGVAQRPCSFGRGGFSVGWRGGSVPMACRGGRTERTTEGGQRRDQRR